MSKKLTLGITIAVVIGMLGICPRIKGLETDYAKTVDCTTGPTINFVEIASSGFIGGRNVTRDPSGDFFHVSNPNGEETILHPYQELKWKDDGKIIVVLPEVRVSDTLEQGKLLNELIALGAVLCDNGLKNALNTENSGVHIERTNRN